MTPKNFAIQTFHIAIAMISCLMLNACGADNESDEPKSPSDSYEQRSEVFQKLKGTSWKLIADKHYSNGNFTHDNVQRWPERNGLILTFSTMQSPHISYNGEEYTNAYSLFCSGYNIANAWEIIKGQLHVDHISNAHNILYGFYDVVFSGNNLLLYVYDDNGLPENIVTLSKSEISSEPNDNQDEINSSSHEKPEIGLEDYTCYTTSITLKYRIYNQDEAKVSSATGYYGTSSPSKSIAATVSGSLITIRATGLTKGTTYYFKCTAKGKGGSTTSETTRLSTEY